MNSDTENIRSFMSNYIEINDKEWEYFSSMFRFKNIAKKEIVLNEGYICKDVFFVLKGLLKTYTTDSKGIKKTFHFSRENTFATDYESFLKGTPSKYSIQAIEETTVALMSIETLQNAYKTLRFGNKLGRILAEIYFFIYSDKIQSIYTQTPLERYNNMNTLFPNILQRVPQYDIASYLNITPVHLSRLKKL